MHRVMCLAAVSISLVVLAPGCSSGVRPQPASSRRPAARIGVYETRAIAVAWAGSKYNRHVDELTVEYKKAKAAGDEKRMAELKKEGSRRQDRLHEQGFGRAPVDDLLTPISDRIPEICAAAGVERIVPIWSTEAKDQETVDVTNQLVAEYQPSEKTLRTIAELRKHRPIDPPYHEHH